MWGRSAPGGRGAAVAVVVRLEVGGRFRVDGAATEEHRTEVTRRPATDALPTAGGRVSHCGTRHGQAGEVRDPALRTAIDQGQHRIQRVRLRQRPTDKRLRPNIGDICGDRTKRTPSANLVAGVVIPIRCESCRSGSVCLDQRREEIAQDGLKFGRSVRLPPQPRKVTRSQRRQPCDALTQLRRCRHQSAQAVAAGSTRQRRAYDAYPPTPAAAQPATNPHGHRSRTNRAEECRKR
jgi:hypothetical protein